MENDRIPKDILYEELASIRRTKGRPQLRYTDVCKRDIKALDISTDYQNRVKSLFLTDPVSGSLVS